jgi:hypothetical protein
MLHGVVSRGFANLVYPGPRPIGVCANQTYVLDQLSSHVAYIIFGATGRAGAGTKVTIEPTGEAEDQWAGNIVARVGAVAALANCTRGDYNNDGEMDKSRSMEELMNAARLVNSGEGIADYLRILKEWRSRDELDEHEVKCVSIPTAWS